MYFGIVDLEYKALKNLMNLHKNYFNNMFKRIKNGIIDNYIEYLDKPWSEIIFYPQFHLFKNMLDKIISMKRSDISDLLKQEVKNWPKEVTEILENSTIEFID